MRRILSLVLSLGLICAWGSAALAGDPVQDAVKKLQKAKKIEERVEAARFPGGRNQAEAVEALALALFKPPPERFPQTLVREMRTRYPKTRQAALSACRDLGGDEDVAVWAPEAQGLLRDAEESVRGDAVWENCWGHP